MGPYYCHTNITYLGPDPKHEEREAAFTAGFQWHEQNEGPVEAAIAACPYSPSRSDHEKACRIDWLAGWHAAHNQKLNSHE